VNHLPVAAVLLPLAAAFCIAFLGAMSRRLARAIAQVAVILDLSNEFSLRSIFLPRPQAGGSF